MDPTNLPRIETERLVLRMLTVEDADDVYDYARSPAVARHVSWDAHHSVEQTVCYLMTVADAYSRGDLVDWGVVLKESGKVIGSCGFSSWNREHHFAEMGYAFGEDHWNRGLATECARAVIGFGFEQMGLNRIEALCFPRNRASARVLEKCGMKLEGLLEGRVMANGVFNDALMYSIVRSAGGEK